MLSCGCCSGYTGLSPRSPPQAGGIPSSSSWECCLPQAHSQLSASQALPLGKRNFPSQCYMSPYQEKSCKTWPLCLNLRHFCRASSRLPMRSAKASAAITLQFNLLNPASISLSSLCSHLDDSPVSFLHANLWLRVCFLGNLISDTLYFHNMLDSPLFDCFTYAVPSALNNSAPPHTLDACWAQSYWSLTPSAVQI